MSERWRQVLGYEGYYEVSDFGRVRSIDRVVTFSDGRVRAFAGRMCKPKRGAYGYPLVLLSAGMDRKKWVAVHLLVLRAFVGPAPSSYEACHNNGDRQDARLSNLRYDTRSGNHADKWRHGTMPHGETHDLARYSDEVVEAVRLHPADTVTELARRFGMSRTHVWNLRNGKRRVKRFYAAGG